MNLGEDVIVRSDWHLKGERPGMIVQIGRQGLCSVLLDGEEERTIHHVVYCSQKPRGALFGTFCYPKEK